MKIQVEAEVAANGKTKAKAALLMKNPAVNREIIAKAQNLQVQNPNAVPRNPLKRKTIII